MAVSSILSGTTYGSRNNAAATRLPTTACPTCGGDAARTSTAKAYGSAYTGRGTDSFACATCGNRTSVASANSNTARGAGNFASSGSSYCPTCGNSPVSSGSSRVAYSSSSQTSGTSNTYGRVNCPTCGNAATRIAANNISVGWAR